MLFSALVFSLISCSVGPRLYAVAFLLVIDPFSYVLSAVGMNVETESVCLVVDPTALVDVAVCVDESSFPIGL